MAETIFKAKFFTDHVWIWLFFFIVFGIPSLVFSIGGMIYALIYMTGVPRIVLFFVFLSLIIVAWAFFFGFLCISKQKVVFSSDYIEYDYPSYALFWTKRFRIQKKNIRAIALGFIPLQKIFPERMKSKTISMIPIELFIEIAYFQDNKVLSIKLPKFNNPQYYLELKKLIKDAGLKQTELAFIFKK